MADYSFNEYEAARQAAQGEPYHDFGKTISLAAMGLAGEAGEFVELVKKHLFHGKPLDREKATKELGDVLWYVMYAANAIGVSLERVAIENDRKLRERYPNGFSEAAASVRPAESGDV